MRHKTTEPGSRLNGDLTPCPWEGGVLRKGESIPIRVEITLAKLNRLIVRYFPCQNGHLLGLSLVVQSAKHEFIILRCKTSSNHNTTIITQKQTYSLI